MAEACGTEGQAVVRAVGAAAAAGGGTASVLQALVGFLSAVAAAGRDATEDEEQFCEGVGGDADTTGVAVLVVAMVVGALLFAVGLASGLALAWRFSQQTEMVNRAAFPVSSGRRRCVGTQSMTTYARKLATPRFQLIRSDEDGVWSE